MTSKGKRSSSDSFPPCRGECTVVLYAFDTYAPLEDTTLAKQLDEDNAQWTTVMHEGWIQTIEPLLGHDQIQRELSGALENHSFRNATGCASSLRVQQALDPSRPRTESSRHNRSDGLVHSRDGPPSSYVPRTGERSDEVHWLLQRRVPGGAASSGLAPKASANSYGGYGVPGPQMERSSGVRQRPYSSVVCNTCHSLGPMLGLLYLPRESWSLRPGRLPNENPLNVPNRPEVNIH